MINIHLKILKFRHPSIPQNSGIHVHYFMGSFIASGLACVSLGQSLLCPHTLRNWPRRLGFGKRMFTSRPPILSPCLRPPRFVLQCTVLSVSASLIGIYSWVPALTISSSWTLSSFNRNFLGCFTSLRALLPARIWHGFLTLSP